MLRVSADGSIWQVQKFKKTASLVVRGDVARESLGFGPAMSVINYGDLKLTLLAGVSLPTDTHFRVCLGNSETSQEIIAKHSCRNIGMQSGCIENSVALIVKQLFKVDLM